MNYSLKANLKRLAGAAHPDRNRQFEYIEQQKCLELSSRICRGKLAKAQLLRRLYRRLWRGNGVGALAVLEAERRATKNEAKLDELMAYLQARTAWIPNYRQRRIEQRYIGSAHVEKANDLIVARRQKNRARPRVMR